MRVRTGNVLKNVATGTRVHVRHAGIDMHTLEVLDGPSKGAVIYLSATTVNTAYKIVE